MIVVYGATGYTGRLLCDELAHVGADFAIAGRSQGRLEALRRELQRPELPLRVADTNDGAALVRALEGAKVVVSCAGPFARHGPPVQDAALRVGCHFLDVTGEYEYMLATQLRHEEALGRGVALVNAVGFDVIPTDCAAVLAAERLGGEVAQLRIAFVVDGAAASQGTMRSVLTMTPKGVVYRDGHWEEEPLLHHLWEVDFPPPFGRMPCLSLPWGDVATAPRSTGARQVRCFVGVPRERLALVRTLGQALRLPGSRLLLEQALRLLPEGPTALERTRSHSAVVAEAVSAEGRTATASIACGNGYAFTAVAAAWCARQAAAPGFAGRGVLTPTQAFGAHALLAALAPSGVAFE